MFTVFDINLFYMRNRIMILCTFCAIAIFSSAQGKFSIKGNAGVLDLDVSRVTASTVDLGTGSTWRSWPIPLLR